MSSLIVSHDLHLMMLEVAVKNLFVPWISEFDKILLKKTIVNFRMLDDEWTSLSPNRHDHRPYSGSSYENENFYGGRSVVFCVPADFFKKKTYGIDVQLYIQKEVCKYLEVDSCQTVGFTAVPVDDLLNSIAKQICQRDELAEHLSDFYKRQIISRSTTGTYTLFDENLRNTEATISLYIRISYLDKCLITEITRVESARRTFCVRGELDERQPYLSRELTPEELQSGPWNDVDFLRFPHGRLICRCEELLGKKSADLASTTRETVAATAAIATTAVADAAQDIATIATRTVAIDVVADSTAIPVAKVAGNAVAIGKRKAPADYDALDNRTDAAALANTHKRTIIPLTAIDDEIINGDQGDTRTEDLIGSVIKGVKPDAVIRTKRKGYAIRDNGRTAFKKAVPTLSKSKPEKYTRTIGIMERGKRISPPHKRTTIPLTAIDDEIINGDQGDTRTEGLIGSVIKGVKPDAVIRAKRKGYAIRDNGRTAFKKAVPTSSKSKPGRYTTTIGITERGKRISPPPSPPFSCLQTYPLCCQLQPHLTCFIDCLDVSPCYCYWTPCPSQFFYTV